MQPLRCPGSDQDDTVYDLISIKQQPVQPVTFQHHLVTQNSVVIKKEPVSQIAIHPHHGKQAIRLFLIGTFLRHLQSGGIPGLCLRHFNGEMDHLSRIAPTAGDCHRTISREFGSGGRTIGKKVAEELGIPCYDSELIEKVASESGFDANYIKDAGEYAPGGFLSSAFSHRSSGPNNADYLWKIQYKIITELAEKGPCVIVGRCADYILRERADCLRVFIHADLAFRAERIVKEYGEREESPEQRLKDKDKRRAAYHRFYTNMKWGHAQNYDVTLNSGTLGIDKCVDIIKDLY